MAKRKKKSRIVVIAVLLLLTGGVAAALILGKKDESVQVTVEAASKRTIIQTVSAVGTIKPETEVKISSEVSGEIIQLNVQEGDTVRPGQLLARIQPDILETQLEQSSAATEAARTRIDAAIAEVERSAADYERAKKLLEKQFISKEEFDRIVAALRTAEARLVESRRGFEQSEATLKQSKATASRTVLYSPIGGVVTSLASEKGEKVVGTAQMQGTEMMTISDLSVINVIAEVTENDIVLVNIGDTVRISVDALPDETLTGVVYQIGNSAKRAGAGQEQVVNFEVRIRIIDSHPRLRPGMSCNVLIETEVRPDVLSVPLMAVTIRKVEVKQDEKDETITDEKTKKQRPDRRQEVVYVKEGDKAVIKEVKTGISDNGYIEIVEGVREGEEVVSGSYRAITKELFDGAAIRTKKTQ